jgi:hypothetical protein
LSVSGAVVTTADVLTLRLAVALSPLRDGVLHGGEAVGPAGLHHVPGRGPVARLPAAVARHGGSARARLGCGHSGEFAALTAATDAAARAFSSAVLAGMRTSTPGGAVSRCAQETAPSPETASMARKW